MEIGQPYNPRKLFYGVFVPEWLLERRELSQGAKLCFAVLCRHTDDEGACDRDGDALAAELGVHLRQLRDYVKELTSASLIDNQRRGLGQTNVYRFRWHPWAEAAACRMPAAALPEMQDSARQEVRNMATPEMHHSARQEMQDSARHSLSQSTDSEKAPNGARAREDVPPSYEFEEPPEREQARNLLKATRKALYRFTGAEVTGRQQEDFLEQIAAHFENGREVDADLIESAVVRAKAAWKEAGGNQRRGVGWVLNALRDLLQEGGDDGIETKPEFELASAIPPWADESTKTDRKYRPLWEP